MAFLHWNHDWNGYHFPENLLPKAVQQIKDLGVGFIRMDILWSDVQPEKRKFDFARYDHILSLLKGNNINVLGVLQYNNSILDNDKNEVWNHPPSSFHEFSHYVQETVTHYRNIIHYWEIWNEPNHAVYWAQPKDALKKYSELLKLSYAAAKEANPTCMVLNGGLTTPVAEDVSNLYKQGCRSAFDILNIHTFLNPLSPNRMQEFDDLLGSVRDVMKKNDDLEKRLWITEMGCPGIPKGLPPQNWFAGQSMNEDQQAEWLREIFTHVKKYPFVEKLFWAFYRDLEGEFKDATDYFGLVRKDFSAKPSYRVLKNLIRSEE